MKILKRTMGGRIPGHDVFLRTVWLHKCRISACVRISSDGYALRSFSDGEDDNGVEVFVERICEAIGVEEIRSEKEITVSGEIELP